MKTIGITAAVLALLAFTGCKKPIVQTSTPEPVPAPEIATKAPPQTSPAPSAEPARELAPPGVFYLLTAARVETPDGIRGLAPGTGVKRVRDGVYLTPYGEIPLELRQITNDMALARQARDADRAAQASAQARMAADRARAAEQERAANAAAAKAAATPEPRYIDGTISQGGTALQSSTALGSSHTKTDDGVLWQKSPDGKYWVPVKFLGGGTRGLPSRRPIK